MTDSLANDFYWGYLTEVWTRGYLQKAHPSMGDSSQKLGNIWNTLHSLHTLHSLQASQQDGAGPFQAVHLSSKESSWQLSIVWSEKEFHPLLSTQVGRGLVNLVSFRDFLKLF